LVPSSPVITSMTSASAEDPSDTLSSGVAALAFNIEPAADPAFRPGTVSQPATRAAYTDGACKTDVMPWRAAIGIFWPQDETL
jgi:hypothetical protein